MSEPRVSVLMVCLGNICRSPTAEAVFQQRLEQRGWHAHVQVDSAGTGDWHVGEAPDRRSQQHAAKRSYRLAHLRARQVRLADFEVFDYILAMDRQNLRDLEVLCPEPLRHKLSLFLAPINGPDEVPDPYYGGAQGFEQVLDLVEAASDAWLEHLAARHPLP